MTTVKPGLALAVAVTHPEAQNETVAVPPVSCNPTVWGVPVLLLQPGTVVEVFGAVVDVVGTVDVEAVLGTVEAVGTVVVLD